jgi:hypothetical protein
MRPGSSACRNILRRSLIAGVLGAAASEEVAAEGAETDPHIVAQVALKTVVKAMAQIHGGLWDAHVDHVAGFILIRPSMDQLSL